MEIPEKFNALVVRETGDNHFVRSIETKRIRDLPPGDILVKVMYSSLNYKDALSASGNRGVTRRYPHTPGIDAAGIVAHSEVPEFKPGDKVIVTSYDLGMNTPGGFGQYIRVPAEWVVSQPEGLTGREAMCYGTAGFTAALSVWHLLQNGITPDRGDILVSGATGGVGGMAVGILSCLGFSVTAINGRVDRTDYLKAIGATKIISIAEAIDTSDRPLLKNKWAGSVDSVGGDILATTLKSAGAYATVTCCGNIASPNFATNVYPFILRGIKLVGIDSQNCPMSLRKKIWQKIADGWQVAGLDTLIREVPLPELDKHIEMMLERKHKGRIVVNMAAEK